MVMPHHQLCSWINCHLASSFFTAQHLLHSSKPLVSYKVRQNQQLVRLHNCQALYMIFVEPASMLVMSATHLPTLLV
jgi:hypothetical protein